MQNAPFWAFCYTFDLQHAIIGLLLLLILPLWESVIVLCFIVRYFMSILVLQSSWWGRESWLLCLICLPGALWWLNGSSSRCHGAVCSLWLWYFLIILTYHFWKPIVVYLFEWPLKTGFTVITDLYYSTIRSLYRHVVCNVPVSCKVNGDRNQLEAWLDSDLIFK